MADTDRVTNQKRGPRTRLAPIRSEKLHGDIPGFVSLGVIVK